MARKTEFLYLSEEDTIQAGVLDAEKCVNNAEEVFKLLSVGDYLMGGANHNSHGMGIVFPKETPFPNMPVAGPDRRFVAMPAYLGGRFDVCGQKWYGSNAANPSKGLPRSVLMVTINNKDTGEPLAFMSANLLSAARTGAVPGVAARHLARKDSKVCAVLGCGPINKSCFRSIASQLPNLETVYCYDLFEDKAAAFAAWAEKECKIKGVASADLQTVMKDADVVTVAASRLKPLVLKDEWVKEGATVLVTGPVQFDQSYWLDTKIIYDNIRLHEAYVQEAIESGDKKAGYASVIGGPIYTLIDQGRLPALKESVSMGDVILDKGKGRTNNKERITFIACGMATFDVGLGYELWDTAVKKGIGTKLLLWDEPYQMRE
ncbi:MAG: tyramine oxidase subunit B [Lachnoclostridium edouardi]|uniref:tyramine oxidase subunit B n=1 Tax=Lachnoclostridium edouardi TaxID=1926283 RepID=UPI0026DB16F9|nr:tyramine oxidase subunit B [Lachnoclostridium edouardi]MDO4279187.1 tyramine oxidase subunit B [Lachnoclostridium edouardi]